MNRYDDLIASRRFYLYIVFVLASILYGIKVIRFNYGFFQTYLWQTLLDNLDIIFLVLITFPFFVTWLFRLFITDDFFYSKSYSWFASERLLLKRVFHSWRNFQIPHLLAMMKERRSLTPIKTIEEAIAYVHRNPFFLLYVDQDVFNEPEFDLVGHFRFDSDHPYIFQCLLFYFSPEVLNSHNEIYKTFKDPSIAPFHKILAESPYNDNIHRLSKAFNKHHPSYTIIDEPKSSPYE